MEQELLAQQSLLRGGERPLAVDVAIPDVVPAGGRYDVDLIVKNRWPGPGGGRFGRPSDEQLSLRSVPTCRWLPRRVVLETFETQQPGSQTGP